VTGDDYYHCKEQYGALCQPCSCHDRLAEPAVQMLVMYGEGRPRFVYAYRVEVTLSAFLPGRSAGWFDLGPGSLPVVGRRTLSFVGSSFRRSILPRTL
jgi:hypothetical protein